MMHRNTETDFSQIYLTYNYSSLSIGHAELCSHWLVYLFIIVAQNR